MVRIRKTSERGAKEKYVMRVNMSWQVVRKVKVAKEEESESIR